MNLTIAFRATCRSCQTEQEFEVNSRELPDIDDNRLIESLREQGLKDYGWINGYCPACLRRRFVDKWDKADHDNKCQREVDP